MNEPNRNKWAKSQLFCFKIGIAEYQSRHQSIQEVNDIVTVAQRKYDCRNNDQYPLFRNPFLSIIKYRILKDQGFEDRGCNNHNNKFFINAVEFQKAFKDSALSRQP